MFHFEFGGDSTVVQLIYLNNVYFLIEMKLRKNERQI